MSSIAGMRKAKVLPLPVFAAARTSLQKCKHIRSVLYYGISILNMSLENLTYLPSSKGRMDLCWISVMCSKPISFTPFSEFSLTSPAREANDVSSNAPETVVTSYVMLEHICFTSFEVLRDSDLIPASVHLHLVKHLGFFQVFRFWRTASRWRSTVRVKYFKIVRGSLLHEASISRSVLVNSCWEDTSYRNSRGHYKQG